MNWSEKIIYYITDLRFNGKLPRGISIMNPYAESTEALRASMMFYRKFYDDGSPRQLILGINPGRHGAGATGIPFTDPKRLKELGLPWEGTISHEPSSVYVYDMVRAYGGPEAFYGRYFINSVSPLGFTIQNKAGRDVNFNYYDTPALYKAMLPFIRHNLETLREMGFQMDRAYVLGVKNRKFLGEVNSGSKYFGDLVTLEHPRYIMQYKLKSKEQYIGKYLRTLGE
jgi:hypothetical protein